MSYFSYNIRLKPETPWQTRRYIRVRENEAERLRLWIYRLGLSLEILVAGMLIVCAVHYSILFR